MKWLFIIIALLNITFGGYNLFLEKPIQSKNIQSNNIDNKQIKLLSELEPKEIESIQEQPLEETILPDINDKTEDVVLTKSLKKEIEPSDEADIKKDTSNPIQKKDNLCYKLGPFSKNAMNDIRLILEEEYKNKLSFGIETTSATTYYRIYIPPLKDKTLIKETLTILDDNGLKDHYVMSIDGRKNAIALGVFKQRSAAQKVAQKASKIGLSTTIEAISDDKNSLYKLMVIFQKNQVTERYQEIILEKKLLSIECENKG